MTQFLDRQLAASKAARKQRAQTAQPQESSATERAVASLQRAMGRDLKKADNQNRLIAKAIAETMPELIAAMDEEALIQLFFALERLATASNRRRIAKHPLRDDIIDDMHAEADEEYARLAEEAAKAAADAEDNLAEKPAAQGGSKDATPKGDAPDSTTAH